MFTPPPSRLLALLVALFIGGCATPMMTTPAPTSKVVRDTKGADVAVYALGLVGTGYRYGGKNPKAGLDCSGMVSHIFSEAAGLTLLGSAADIARRGRPLEREGLQPGDLVFFNTQNRPFSHVGIYIGDERFVHAPSTNGQVRIDRLTDRYYAERYEAARSLFD